MPRLFCTPMLGIYSLLVGTLMLPGCAESKAETQPSRLLLGEAPRWIESQVLQPFPFTPTLHAPGQAALREGSVVEVGAVVHGRVREVYVQAGQQVKEGEPLFRLESVQALQARSELQQARALFRAAQTEAQRQTKLNQQHVGLAHEHTNAQANLAQARANLVHAEGALALLGEGDGGDVLVRAPVSGTILERSLSVGSLVSAETGALIRLGDPQAVWFEAYVSERELSELALGNAAHIRLADGTTLDGQISRIATFVDPNTRRAQVIVTPQGSEQLPRPGSWAHIELAGRTRQGIALPNEAVLIKERGQHLVYVEGGETGSFEARPIQPGRRWGNQVEVLDGLQVNERVVIKGALLVDSQASQLL